MPQQFPAIRLVALDLDGTLLTVSYTHLRAHET